MLLSTFLHRQDISLDVRNHLLGICNHRLSIRNHHVGTDRQLGLKETPKFAKNQRNELNVR